MDERLEKIRDFYKQFKRLPSYAEMLDLFKLSSKNAIFKIINSFVEEGFLEKMEKRLLPTKKFFAIPLLGYIKAGFPTTADEDLNLLSLEDYLIEKPNSTFMLKVNGDSMINAGILPNDLVLVEKKNQATSGSIVLARIDGEWTLKILRKKGQRCFLEAANPKYPIFSPKNQLEVFGVVRGVVRKYN
jgi:repressor LexA